MISRNLIFYLLYSVKMSVFYVQFYLIPYFSLLFISLFFFIFYLLLLQVRLSFAYFPEFSLSSKVDSYDVKVGGLVTECCRQFQAFILSIYPIPLKSRRLKPPGSQFFSRLPALNENPVFYPMHKYIMHTQKSENWRIALISIICHIQLQIYMLLLNVIYKVIRCWCIIILAGMTALGNRSGYMFC